MSDVLRFVVPMPPNLTNNGGRKTTHWRQFHREKKSYLGLLDSLQGVGGILGMQGGHVEVRIPVPPLQPFASVSIRSVMYLGGAMDDDNAMARHKPLLDWLKTRGYLVDDRKKNIVWEGLPEQVVKRDGNYRIELTLTPL